MSNGRFAKVKEKKRSAWPFVIFMVVYAVLALVAIGFGLDWFYGFIEAYENTKGRTLSPIMENIIYEGMHKSLDKIISGETKKKKSKGKN